MINIAYYRTVNTRFYYVRFQPTIKPFYSTSFSFMVWFYVRMKRQLGGYNSTTWRQLDNYWGRAKW